MTKHYPSELKERAVRLVLDAESEPGGRRGACTRVGAHDMSPRQSDSRQDPIFEEDAQCGQEGVEFIVRTKGLTPSASD